LGGELLCELLPQQSGTGLQGPSMPPPLLRVCQVLCWTTSSRAGRSHQEGPQRLKATWQMACAGQSLLAKLFRGREDVVGRVRWRSGQCSFPVVVQVRTLLASPRFLFHACKVPRTCSLPRKYISRGQGGEHASAPFRGL
jgi:hypothetical protein